VRCSLWWACLLSYLTDVTCHLISRSGVCK